MELHTASEVIDLAVRLEERGAEFYQSLSSRYPKHANFFLSMAKENRKTALQVKRVYYEVITDAIEGCFSFQIDPEEYALDTSLKEGASLSDALKRAIEIEERSVNFYSNAAQQSKSLMADIPRAFKLIEKKRTDRISKLRSLQQVEV